MRWDQALRERMDQIRREHNAIMAGDDPGLFIPTGLSSFDRIGGIRRKICTLVLADTGMGKSQFILQLRRGAAKAGFRVIGWDMEDPWERTADRDLSRITGINNAKMGTGALTDDELARVLLAEDDLEWASRVDVYDKLVRPKDVLERLGDEDYDLATLDYLQGFPHGESGREQAISNFLWSATKIAQDRNKGLVVASQVKPEVEQRGIARAESSRRKNPDQAPDVGGFIPFPREVPWCTDAANIAKEILILDRPGKHYRKLDYAAKDDVMHVYLPKRNFGAEGKITLGIDPKTAEFRDLR